MFMVVEIKVWFGLIGSTAAAVMAGVMQSELMARVSAIIGRVGGVIRTGRA